MKNDDIIVKPIGIIHTPYKTPANMPIQPLAAKGVEGTIVLDKTYVDGLKDLEGFSHITLIYFLHNSRGYELIVKPFMDDVPHGIFATRSPKRPNAIGLSTVKLLGIEGNILRIEMVDMLDGTPLIDIKPFYERFDNRVGTQAGWLNKISQSPVSSLKSDDRFS